MPGRLIEDGRRWLRNMPGQAGILLLSCLFSAAPAEAIGGAANSTTPSLRNASWIWREAADDTCHLRLAFELEEKPEWATLVITADNGYEVFINGSSAGSDVGAETEVWQSVERYDVTPLLARGPNVIGIQGVDLGGIRGLVAAMNAGLKGRPEIRIVTGDHWRAAAQGDPRDYSRPDSVENAGWAPARVVGPMGMAPWGSVEWSEAVAARRPRARIELTEPDESFVWPGEIAYVGQDCSTYVPLKGEAWGVVFRVRDWSRAYTEFDLPQPSKIGRKLYAVKPGPGAVPRVLVDAGRGVLGSPSATFDGRSVLLAMVPEGEKFFSIYRVSVDGSKIERLTRGPFHDIDPQELPDGRIVFASTRIGTFEEYHSPPSRALFVMHPDGSSIRPITFTPIFDNEPKVMADGRMVFIRSDNFFDRAKVETLLQVMHPDGTRGSTEVGADVGPDYGVRLRAFGYGSPAPLPDGRLAFISSRGNFIAAPGHSEGSFHRLPDDLGDLAPLPDGRLLATVLRRDIRGTVSDVIAVIDPADNRVVPVYKPGAGSVHSPIFLGEVPRPPVIPDSISPAGARVLQTGYLFCQDARFTRKTKADWENIKAIRVLGAKGLTVRSSHSHIVHVGHEAVELGTVPLASDGSFFVEVPADMPLALQAVDAEGRSELNEMSWISVRPGERRSCLGCHQPREAAPGGAFVTGLALQAAPAKLLGQGDPHRFRGNNAGVTGMMDLQFERFREVASLNRQRESADADGAGKAEVNRLLQELATGNCERRISAAQRLAIFRRPAAASGLAGALGDADREVRRAVALALAGCGTRDSVPALVKACADPDPLAAQAAAVAFENLTGHALSLQAFEPIEQRARAAQAWAEALGPWAEIEQALIDEVKRKAAEQGIQVLKDVPLPDGKSRAVKPVPSLRRAIVALGHVGGEAARAALREYVSEARRKNPYPAFQNHNRTDSFTFDTASPWNPRTLQEAVRALGNLRDLDSISLLGEILAENRDPRTANLFLAEAAIEALGRMDSSQAEALLIAAFRGLREYWEYVGWYSDHPALYACHSSPVHARIIEALDYSGSTAIGELVPGLIRSVPTDPDRALFLPNDDYEVLVGRVIRRSGRGPETISTALAILGDSSARASEEIRKAIGTTHSAWGGHPGPENRAAQILSLVCRDRQLEPAIRAAFERYVNQPEEPVKRELGNPTWTPVRHWVLFYLARALGNLQDSRSTETLMSVLSDDLNEARHGRPDPATPEIHFLHLDYTPCWRAGAAWALGRIGDPRATPVLLRAVANLDNAPDVRHSAAVALEQLADPKSRAALKQLAADYPEVSTRKALLHAVEKIQSVPRQTVSR